MVTTSNDVLLRSIQGYQDIQEWRNFLASNGKGDYQVWSNADPFSTVDVMQVSPMGRVSYVELKARNVRIDQYPDCLVDEWKVTQLQRLAVDSGDKVFLVALYPQSSQIAIWEIREDDEFSVRDVMANATTLQYGASQKKNKRLVSLRLCDAKVYSHQFSNLSLSV